MRTRSPSRMPLRSASPRCMSRCGSRSNSRNRARLANDELRKCRAGGEMKASGYLRASSVLAPGADTELARKYPLAFISPPARHFLNSSFANLARFREFEREPHLDIDRKSVV